MAEVKQGRGIESDKDHIHLLVECTPQYYIPNIFKALKGVSARLLFLKHPNIKRYLWGGHLWNPSYFVATVSENTEEQIRNYIQNQKELIDKTIGCCRFVFNYSLAKQKEKDKYWCMLEKMVQQGYFQQNYDWLKEVDSISLQSSVENLANAYTRYYKKLAGTPRFKSKKNNVQSYITKAVNGNIQINNKAIKLPKLGFVNIKLSRPVDGTIKNVTVSKTNTGKYFVSVLCDVDIQPLSSCENKIGIDLGLKTFAKISNGKDIENPKFLQRTEKKIIKAQRELSRKPIGSKNRDKARMKLAKLYECITNQRKDFLHKESTKLIRENQSIVMEDLQVKSMMKNEKLAKGINVIIAYTGVGTTLLA